jgi:hypothetical protein
MSTVIFTADDKEELAQMLLLLPSEDREDLLLAYRRDS